MLALDLSFEDGSHRVFEAPLPVSIGRAAECDLRLKAWRVGRFHATIERRVAGIFIDDFGTLGGTFVNGRRITQYGPLTSSDEIIIGPCLIRLRDQDGAPHVLRDKPDDGSGAPISPVHACEPLAVPGVRDGTSSGGSNRYQHLGMVDVTSRVLGGNLIDAECSVRTDERMLAAQNNHHACNVIDEELPSGSVYGTDYIKHCQRLHSALLNALDLRRRDIATMSDGALRTEAVDVLSELLTKDDSIPPNLDRAKLIRTVVDEAVGLGPLEPLLEDSRVTEIMVNRHDEIYVETAGRLHRHAGGFSSEQAVLGVIERIVSPMGRRIDESSPMVDVRLRDGSRVNAIIPPVALRGASITIRKFPTTRPKMADLLRVGALDFNISRFLSQCVLQRKNIIVSGGTGSGKTTLLNVLSSCIPSHERIITIEDAAELQLGHEHLVSLEARPANLEGRGAVLIRDLVRNALRMRPDRIVVGECRGAEAFDMLAAMNTGHEGSLTTLHANSPRDALSRLETMILMAGMDLPLVAVREQVSSSVDIIVQQARLSSGRRVITSIVQVTGQEGERIQLQELFLFHPGPPASFAGCGTLPEDISLDDLSIDMFDQRTEVTVSANAWSI